MPRRTSSGHRCYNPFYEEDHKRDPCTYSHTDPAIEDALVINDNSLPILENDILMEDDDIFADPSTSKFEKSKTDCSDKNHYAGMEVLEQIKE